LAPAGDLPTVQRACDPFLSKREKRKSRTRIYLTVPKLLLTAPFQRIIVAAAAPSISDLLLQQLDENGKLVLPTGSADLQELQLLRKAGSQFTVTNLGGAGHEATFRAGVSNVRIAATLQLARQRAQFGRGN
jgi:hypothetical protein